MIIDKQLKMSDAQADLRNAATYLSTYSIDMGATPSIEDQMYLILKTKAAFTSGTNFVVNLISSSAVTLDADVVIELVLGTFTVANSGLIANKVLKTVRIPSTFASTARYLGVQYVATGNFDAGTMDAFLVPEINMAKPVT